MVNRKSFLSLIGVVLLTFSAQAENLAPQDPFAAVEYMQMPNGLQVYLAPSKDASLTSIHLEVGVGTESESGPTIGVSHLLEHVLFRDKNLADEMSYLQLIKEAGGTANGGTGSRDTTYFGSIPSAKGLWLFETFGKMILAPSFEDRYVQKEKGTIEIERGRPSPIEEMLGFNPMNLLYPEHLQRKGFWETEFNYKKSKKDYTLLEEQLGTRKLTSEQVETHYRDYYYPKNMKLFITGKYDRAQVMNEIEKNWKSLPATIGKVMPPESSAEPRMAPYIRTGINNDPRVQIGAKIWGASPAETAILSSFTNYLSHRMMKEIRNIKGQTYTASAYDYLYKGFGYATVNFSTTKENFDENLKVARQYIDEASEGKLSSEHIKEAINLEISEYNLRGKEADDMMSIANRYANIQEEFGVFTSPYSSLINTNPELYNKTLSKFFVPEMRYESLSQPPLFTHYDQQIVWALSLILMFMGLRAVLTQKFHNNQLRWVRKVEYPPIKLAEGLALVAVWFTYCYVQYGVDTVFFTDLMQSHVILSQYLYTAATVASLILVAQGFYSFMPRKLMVHGDDLMIKSVTYYSKSIPLSQISKVESVRVWSSPLQMFRRMKSVKYRFYFMTPKFWKKGLLVTLKNGKAYYFSMKNADAAKMELQGFLPTKAEQSEVSKTAAPTKIAA